MNDFFSDLKSIKKELLKEEKKTVAKKEFSLEKESIKDRETRLKKEFKEYMKATDVKEL